MEFLPVNPGSLQSWARHRRPIVDSPRCTARPSSTASPKQ
jgi:hypothetical protein